MKGINFEEILQSKKKLTKEFLLEITGEEKTEKIEYVGENSNFS